MIPLHCFTVWKQSALDPGRWATCHQRVCPCAGGKYAGKGMSKVEHAGSEHFPTELASGDGRAAGEMRAGEVNHVVRRGLTRSSGSAAATAHSPMNNNAGDIACLAVRPATPHPQAAQSSCHPGVTSDQSPASPPQDTVTGVALGKGINKRREGWAESSSWFLPVCLVG